MEVIKGIPVSPGVFIGRAFVLHDVLERVPYRPVAAEAVQQQHERLAAAVAQVTADLEADRDRVADRLGPEPAKIFEFHLGLLHDQALIESIRARIEKESVTAEYAAAAAFGKLAEQFRAMDDEMFRQKDSDVLDLERRLLGKLIGYARDQLERIEGPVIVVAHELTPAQAASLDVSKVKGFATDAGGRTSHTSIIGAALGIPAVVGCQRVTENVSDGEQVVIDGGTGVVIARPDEETIRTYRQDIERLASYAADLKEQAALAAETLDGTRIHLMGNIEFAHEVDAILANGGDGVGLYRTEYLYLTGGSEPSEEEQLQEYCRALKLLAGKPLTIRTFDLGADKYTQERTLEPERNPFLGLRSIRYCLQNLPMFRRHLRAIVRASAEGPLRIMFPLISTALELRQAKMILRDVTDECLEDGIEVDEQVPVGMMIEVPSAALMASVFAREVDFFSIGTNDLIQYTLAVDRGNERVANLFSAASPAVLQLVKLIIRSGKRFNVETSICGEVASEVSYTMLLIGLGLRTLSLVPSQIPKVKRVIRSVDIRRCERLARRVGSFDSERQVINCLREELKNVCPELSGGWSAGSE